MTQSPIDAERIAESTARQLLERAAALDTGGPTLAQLRHAAAEAGISAAAFDAAVAEWRTDLPPTEGTSPRGWLDRLARNTAGLAVGWVAVAALAAAQRAVEAPWLVHKLTDPVGLAIGAIVAARLQAGAASVILGGLAVSQGAEFVMDLSAGAPAIHGFGAHMALMIAGVGGVAIGRAIWGRSSATRGDVHSPGNGRGAESPSAGPLTSGRVARSMHSRC